MVMDYRGLNGITIKDEYPVPRINELINRLGKSSWFSKSDVASGYYQVRVAEHDQWKTTFRTRYGTFQFKTILFGLAGALSTFQRMMQHESDMTWCPKRTRVVEMLKSDLAEVTQVKLFDPDKDIVIKSDASKYAVEAVLEQDGQPIAFEPRKLGPRQQGLPAYKAELVAIVHALMKWKHFIGDREVSVETDHGTLGRMLVQKKSIASLRVLAEQAGRV
ncbi:os07g0510800 related [Cystoisospora suis]|uniref:Os07g0510800 related n=1 Tax=Cystoisospora suis TaxID=483139 RepID=A0A2C6L1E6_9APIC|nr:os07g0510800 related [Cystoisospora suis]